MTSPHAAITAATAATGDAAPRGGPGRPGREGWPGWRERLAPWIHTLRTWPWGDTLRVLGQRFREDRLGLTAGSLTFTTVIALVPLVTVMLAIFSAFPIFGQFQDALQKYLLQSLVPEGIARPVLGAVTQFAAKAHRLGAVGLGVLALTAISLMLTIDRTLNALWRVRQPRPLGQRVLVYWAAATLGPLLLGASLTLTSYAVSASKGWVGALPGGLGLLLDLLEFLMLAGGMAALFRCVPNTAVRWRHAVAGGVFVALGVEAAKAALGWYLLKVPTYNTIYGAFATVPIFLVWLYLVWLVVLFGAVIAAYAPSLSRHLVLRPDAPGLRFERAVQLLRELAAARGGLLQDSAAAHGGPMHGPTASLSGPVHGLAAATLAERLHTDVLEIEPLLELLAGLDWVGRLDEPGEPRHVLLCDPAATPARPLLAALLLAPSETLQPFWRRARLEEMRLAELLG